MNITIKELREVFTEWDKRYRENPEEYMSEAVHLLKETPETYGDSVTPYFIKLHKELKNKKGKK
jgi:hypothetical protein